MTGSAVIGSGVARSRALVPLTIVLAVALVVGSGTAAWAVHRRGQVAATAAAARAADQAVPAEARAALDAGRGYIPVILHFDYRSYDANVAAARTRMTDRFRRPYDTLMAALRPNVLRDRSSRSVSVKDAGVVAAQPGRVTIMAFTTEQATHGDAPPQTTPGRLKAILVKQDGRWLVDGMIPL